MKTVLATVLIALASTLTATAQAANEHGGHGAMGNTDNMGGMHAQAAAPASTTMAEGTVKKVDKVAGKVTLAHGPLTNLGMNMPMTMAFRVKEAGWIDQMKAGDKVRFVAEDINGVLTIVNFEPAK